MLSWRHEPPSRPADGHRPAGARPPRAPRDHAGTRRAPRDLRLRLHRGLCRGPADRQRPPQDPAPGRPGDHPQARHADLLLHRPASPGAPPGHPRPAHARPPQNGKLKPSHPPVPRRRTTPFADGQSSLAAASVHRTPTSATAAVLLAMPGSTAEPRAAARASPGVAEERPHGSALIPETRRWLRLAGNSSDSLAQDTSTAVSARVSCAIGARAGKQSASTYWQHSAQCLTRDGNTSRSLAQDRAGWYQEQETLPAGTVRRARRRPTAPRAALPRPAPMARPEDLHPHRKPATGPAPARLLHQLPGHPQPQAPAG